MAYLLTHFWPGGTEAQYRATVAAVHPADALPDGQLYHAAGPTDGGFLVTAVWEDKERNDSFISGRLMAAMPIDGGFAGAPQERGAEVVNLQTA